MSPDPAASPCRFTDCVIQEINIYSLARQGRAKKFFYRKTRTRLTPLNPKGELVEDGTVSIDHVNPRDPAPEVRQLIGQAETALGQSIDILLNTTAKGSGSSRHAFGCADECDCVRKRQKIKLPDGREVDDPGQTIDGGRPRSPNAVPGEEQAMAVIEKRVSIPGRGTFLLTYEIRLFGTVRRFGGNCVPRAHQGDTSDDRESASPSGEKRTSMAPPSSRITTPLLIGLGVGCFTLSCLAVMAFAAWYFFLRPAGDVITLTNPPTSPPIPETATATPGFEPVITVTPMEATQESAPVTPIEVNTLTAAPTPTEQLPLEIFVADSSAGIVHFSTSSQITNTQTILDSNLLPVENALISITLTIPGGATQTFTSTTDQSGQAAGAFDIFTFGDYALSIDGLQADGYIYNPALNLAEQYPIQVGSQEIVIHPSDRLATFYDDFNEAFSSQDSGFLFDSLHPVVIEQYGEEACRQYLESVIENPIQVEIQALNAFGSWTWERDGFAVDIEHAYSLTNQVTLPDGSTTSQPTHLALAPGGSIAWFTDCGDPLE